MMIARKGRCLLAAAAGSILASAAFAQQDKPPPLPIEPTGVVQSLPADYPPELVPGARRRFLPYG